LAVTKSQCPPDLPGDRNRSAAEIASPTGCPKGKRSAAMSPRLEPGEAGHSCPAYFCRQFPSTLPHLSAQGRTGLQARFPLPDRCKNGPGDPFYRLLPVTECQCRGACRATGMSRSIRPTISVGAPPIFPPKVERVSRPVSRCRTDAKTGLETPFYIDSAVMAGIRGTIDSPSPRRWRRGRHHYDGSRVIERLTGRSGRSHLPIRKKGGSCDPPF
jgi:hypothetical protein